jgi:hypothetical protein
LDVGTLAGEEGGKRTLKVFECRAPSGKGGRRENIKKVSIL